MSSSRRSGDVVLDVKNISLSFGGVKALSDISFDVREHEIRAIIGPNGAGKSSMLNCINGVYQPQQGTITFRGRTFRHMNPRQVAEMGVARTFQNLALFKGMSVLDNIMTGRNLRMKSNLFLQALRFGPAEREEMAHRGAVERIIDFLEIQAHRKTPVGKLPYGLQKRVELARALAAEPVMLLLVFIYLVIQAMVGATKRDTPIKPAADAAWSLKDQPVDRGTPGQPPNNHDKAQ